MNIDLEMARLETPGCEKVTHFNNAGAALMPQPVLDAMTDHLRLEAETGGYEAADLKQDAYEDAYRAVANLINGRPEEIALVENATRAWDMAFYGMSFKEGDRILTSRAEYASNYIAFLQTARRTGASIEVVPCEPDGRISVPALDRMLDDRVKLVALTHVPTNGGLVNPAAEVGKLTRAAGIPFLLDACQSVGQLPLDVERISCDMLSATGRKFLRAPRGTGFLYVRKSMLETLEPPFLDLHAARWTGPSTYEVRKDARRFETWEGNVAGKIGLGVAARYAQKWGLDAIAHRIYLLANLLRDGLQQIPGVKIHDLGPAPCGIVSFTAVNQTSVEIKNMLRSENINVSVSDAESTLLDMEARSLPAVTRASLHYYNSEVEVTRFLTVLDQFSRNLKG